MPGLEQGGEGVGTFQREGDSLPLLQVAHATLPEQSDEAVLTFQSGKTLHPTHPGIRRRVREQRRVKSSC